MTREQILKKRWEEVNRELKNMGCPIDIPKIRPYQDGAYEIVRIRAAYRESNPFYWTITFEAKKPFTGEICLYTMQFSEGMIVVPVLDGQILLKREHRPTTGKWMWELPRGFVNLLVGINKSNPEEIAKALLEKEGSEGAPEIREIVLLDEEGVYEDTGRSVAQLPICLMKISGTLKEQKKRQSQVTWKSFSLEEIRRERLLKDSQSLAALSRLIDAIEFDGMELGG